MRNVYIDAFQCMVPEMLNHLSDLDLRLIRVFMAIVQAGGISPAQWVLNVSQSTLSTQLATLETRLGFRLCTRGRGGFRLSEKGQRFADMARQLLLQVDNFELQARNINKQLVGTLDIGLIGHLPISQNNRISEAITRFRQRDEAVRFNISVSPPRDLEDALLGGKIRIAIGYFWHRVPSLEYTQLFVERQLAYCGQCHPLFANAGALVANDLEDADWAWRSYPLPGNLQSTAPGRVAAVADNMEAMALLIMSGHLGYLPQHFAAPYVARGLMAELNPNLFYYDAAFHVVSPKKSEQDEMTRAFIEDLRHIYLN